MSVWTVQSRPCSRILSKRGLDPGQFRCEALIENENGYFVRIFDLVFHNDLPDHPHRWIGSCELKHELAVSPVEASFMLRKTEYITLYSILDPAFLPEFESSMPELMPNSYRGGGISLPNSIMIMPTCQNGSTI